MSGTSLKYYVSTPICSSALIFAPCLHEILAHLGELLGLKSVDTSSMVGEAEDEDIDHRLQRLTASPRSFRPLKSLEEKLSNQEEASNPDGLRIQ